MLPTHCKKGHLRVPAPPLLKTAQKHWKSYQYFHSVQTPCKDSKEDRLQQK